MIKRELKVNLKSFIIWSSILIAIFLLVYLIYPFIITDATMKDLDELMKVFPPEVLKAFNMDIASISTAYGWFKSEGFMFVLLIMGLYSSILGGSILLREENDKTIEYLSSLPIKRSNIVTNKVIVGILYVLGISILFGIFNYISLLISCEFDQLQFLLLSIIPIFVTLPLFAINLLISINSVTRLIIIIAVHTLIVLILLFITLWNKYTDNIEQAEKIVVNIPKLKEVLKVVTIRIVTTVASI